MTNNCSLDISVVIDLLGGRILPVGACKVNKLGPLTWQISLGYPELNYNLHFFQIHLAENQLPHRAHAPIRFRIWEGVLTHGTASYRGGAVVEEPSTLLRGRFATARFKRSTISSISSWVLLPSLVGGGGETSGGTWATTAEYTTGGSGMGMARILLRSLLELK